jgi:Holliday junction resolvase RusA-like endonuclease
MYAVKIKPLSVNRCWQGKRFKTKEYKAYEQELMYLLPPVSLDPRLDYEVCLEFGVSNSRQDIDNPVKPLLDIIQKKYGIDDASIWELHSKKVKVKKGEEYIRFSFEEYLVAGQDS